MTQEEIQENPLILQKQLVLPNSQKVIFRPLLQSDQKSFGKFLGALSTETNKRFQPHPLTTEAANKICNELNYKKVLRLVALNDKEEIVAYFVLEFSFPLDEVERYRQYGVDITEDNNGRLAPVVADSYQGSGLGSVVMEEALRVAKELGLRKIVLFGGTQATNELAIHFYEKFGFKKAGEFEENDLNNFDMILTL